MSRRQDFLTPSKVTEQLFVGTYRQAFAGSVRAAHGITHLLCVKDSTRFPQDGVPFLHVGLSDYGDSDLRAAVEECVPFIDDAVAAGGRVLVFCSQGVNRSPSALIGYLVVKGASLKHAWETVTAARSMASPHEKYFEQLQALEVDVRGLEAPTLTREDVGPSLQEMLRRMAAGESVDDVCGKSAEGGVWVEPPGEAPAEGGLPPPGVLEAALAASAAPPPP